MLVTTKSRRWSRRQPHELERLLRSSLVAIVLLVLLLVLLKAA